MILSLLTRLSGGLAHILHLYVCVVVITRRLPYIQSSTVYIYGLAYLKYQPDVAGKLFIFATDTIFKPHPYNKICPLDVVLDVVLRWVWRRSCAAFGRALHESTHAEEGKVDLSGFCWHGQTCAGRCR